MSAEELIASGATAEEVAAALVEEHSPGTFGTRNQHALRFARLMIEEHEREKA